jgi:hypothetical protein
MSTQSLTVAVEHFAQTMVTIPDEELERDFAWRYHDEEGLRFAFLGTYHELRDLATATAVVRAVNGSPPTLAQRVLAQYHTAYRDLQALLLGVSGEDGDRAPDVGEWPIRRALLHMIEAERTFFSLICYAVERVQKWPHIPLAESDETWFEAFERPDAAAFAALDAAPLSQVCAFYDDLHRRVLARLQGLSDTDLQSPSWWWEESEVLAVFRIQRMDAHMRQHSIQIEKTLYALDLAPSEIKRLLRLVYAALAEAEGAALGAEQTSAAEWDALAATISERTQMVAP